jgi:hypothetical protein
VATGICIYEYLIHNKVQNNSQVLNCVLTFKLYSNVYTRIS